MQFQRLQMAALFFSVSVTVLSGLSVVRERAGWIVTVVAGLGALANGIVAITKAQERRRLYAMQYTEYSSEKLRYLQNVTPYADPDPEERLTLFSAWLADKRIRDAKQIADTVFSAKSG